MPRKESKRARTKPYTAPYIAHSDDLKPRSKPFRDYEVFSTDKGFGIQVTPKGTKSFFLAYRSPTQLDKQGQPKRRFMDLGTFPDTSLVRARDKCRKARAQLDEGLDPQDEREKEEARRKAEEAEAERLRQLEESRGTVKLLFESYVEHLKAAGKPSWKEAKRALEKDALPHLGEDTKAGKITRDNIKLVISKPIQNGAVTYSNRLLSYIKAAFSYGIRHDDDPKYIKRGKLFYIESHPAAGIRPQSGAEKVGDRNLSTEEVCRLWNGLCGYGLALPTEIAIKLILATGGQRVIEVLGARWSEFRLDDALWELPPARTKNRRPHVVPLPPLALKLLKALQPITGTEEFLFPRRVQKDGPVPMPITSLAQAVRRYCEDTGFDFFTPRDLRRTCKSRMGEIGASKDIRDRIHNHALSDVSSKHYDRYDYLPQKRKVLEKWDAWLTRTIRNETAENVVPLQKANE